MDPILLELYRHRFSGVAEEMGVTLQRTSYSPNIKERLDFSCAVFDSRGGMVAQAAHIPVHLGAMPRSLEAALDAIDVWRPGDTVILNDPYAGGTHLPDITMISPVFVADRLVFFAASRAHHADVGGMSPGSLPLSGELYQEGVIIPPVKWRNEGRLAADLEKLVLRNVRTPEERRGDLAAQQAAHSVAETRLAALIDRHGAAEVEAYAAHLSVWSERLLREHIRQWPDGVFRFEDTLEIAPGEAPNGEEAIIRVAARIEGDGVTFDFEGTSPAVTGSLNAVLPITESACYYAVRCLAASDIPMNAGCFAPVRVTAPPGCLVHADPPHAVSAGNVETSQRIVDAVFGALAQAMPARVSAAGQGTMNNLTIGGSRADGSPYAYYETIGGGMGASAGADGLSGVHVHMSNTLNTPVEALEMTFPFRIETYALRRGSGGAGERRGGDGLIRAYRLLRPATVTVISERRETPPWGLQGGAPGACGRNTLVRPGGGEETLPAKFSRRLEAGDVLRIETPGGGGWGRE
ncbi:MAG: hydantoinase B/oxoprolinase family protein [Bacteroidetes bacterium SB0662_bin_6]|nr:hydantoinase B/oxoprolinase family protein [Bacteroidetes bacterium SB0668_bin_1]MYE04546.1 hydantoinase B/oxoprolinase family protein [Bacteroidetes bacterium SB0662_bin_6]